MPQLPCSASGISFLADQWIFPVLHSVHACILARLLSPLCPVCSPAAPNPYSNFRGGSSPRARVTVNVFSSGRADS